MEPKSRTSALEQRKPATPPAAKSGQLGEGAEKAMSLLTTMKANISGQPQMPDTVLNNLHLIIH